MKKVDVLEIINLLYSTREETLPLFDLNEEKLSKTYAPGKWKVKQLLHHLADAETVLYERIRRTISEPKPVLWGFDPDKWNLHLNYETIPISMNKKIYDGVRDGVIYMAKNFYEKYGQNEFIHNETGLRTLQEEINKVALHNAHHLEQIKKALEQ